ncbi:MAG: HAD family hydrolase [Myxococcota bacterium]
MKPFVFLDRDGTLTEDRGYTHRLEDYALLPGVLDGLRRLADAGFAFAIVTNQSGIARGHFSRAEFDAFQRHLVGDLARQGIVIESTLFCPHPPDAGCSCRKPAPGLLHRAERELDADLARSWVVGDRAADLALARAAGCQGAVLVLTGEGAVESRGLGIEVLRASDLSEAAHLIRARSGIAQGAP